MLVWSSKFSKVLVVNNTIHRLEYENCSIKSYGLSVPPLEFMKVFLGLFITVFLVLKLHMRDGDS